jgi:hypothetical protein
LSIWRMSRSPDFGLKDALEQIEQNKPAGHELRQLLAAVVEQIREAEVKGRRAFCVVDDCATDKMGGWHKEHAAIRMAEGVDWSSQDDHFDLAVEVLNVIFLRKAVWEAPA